MSRRPTDDVLAHMPALLRYARTLSRDAAVAEDLVQETMLRAHERRDSLRMDGPVRGWLFAVLHNLFVSGTRRARAEAARLDRLTSIAAEFQPAEQEFAAYLRQIGTRFDALPTGQRVVLHLVAVEGLSYREAAEALGIPIGTVMSRLGRARARLREDQPAEQTDGGRLRIVGGRDVD